MSLAGYAAGDSILLTLSRRLSRLLKPQDTLARISGDEFAIILLSEREPDRIISFADMVRRVVTTPFTYAEREIFLTASIGIALYDPQIAARREEVLRNAEIAMAHAQAATAATGSRSSARPCAPTAATISRWKPTFAMRSTATR